MAARFLDMALDDVAKSRAASNRSPNPRGDGARRGTGPTGRDSPSRSNRSSPYNRSTPEDRWTHDKFDESNQRSSSGGRGGDQSSGNRAQGGEANAKIIVENLHYAVTLEDIKELFDTHAGPVKFAEVKYDLSGRSTGVATILFKTPADAATAIKKLHGIALDGQPMKITYAPLPPNRTQDRRSGGPSKEAPKRDVFSRLGSSEADIASRLGKLNPVPSTTGGGGGGNSGRGGQGSSSHARKQGGGGSSGGGNGGTGSGVAGSSRGGSRDKKKPQVKTAEELDAEMDTYMGDATA